LSLPYYDFLRTVDVGSGLVEEERAGAASESDQRAVVTRYSYDLLGRTTRVSVGDDHSLEIAYENQLLSDSRARLARIRFSRGTDDRHVEGVLNYDYLGRLSREDRLMPDGRWSYRHTRYDENGRVEFVSEWTTSSAFSADLPGTSVDYTDPTYGYEDPFGRPRRVTGPLGEVTEYEYFGTNQRVTVKGLAGGGEAEVPFDGVTTYYTDGLGRLRVVDSPNAEMVAGGADAIYSYDISGNLLKVNLVPKVRLRPTATDRYATDNADNLDQLRTFEYDALGRRTRSREPESGDNRVLAWNALDSAVETQDAEGANRGYFHRTTYDGAGRAVRLERVLVDGASEFSSIHAPGDPGWTADGWSTADSVLCVGETAWYHGDFSCGYARTGVQIATLTSPPIGPLPTGAVLSFRYFREVRNTGAGTGESRDRFRVLVTDAAAPDWTNATEVFYLDSTQISWARWHRVPPIRLEGFENRSVLIRFVFESVDVNPNGALRGIGVGEVAVRRPEAVTIAEWAYDEDFGLPGNKSLGKVTTIKAYDESMLAPDFVRRYEYVQEEGKLSRETIQTDWDGNGTWDEFEADYFYDELGQLVSQHLPHPADRTTQEYRYSYRHGALVGITRYDGTVSEALVPDSIGVPGIEYNVGGGIALIRFGNGTLTRIEPNVAFLPARIWVERPGGPSGSPLFDTGTYTYDGERNIKEMGSDLYRYDAAGRLDWARIASTTYPFGLKLDYTYDAYGNMLSRTVDPPGSGPAGLEFSGRTYSGNRVANEGFEYDGNGNLIREPVHERVGGYRYVFSPEGRLDQVREGSGGKTLQQSRYDPTGHRWMRQGWEDGGKILLSFRDGEGRLASEYVESSATSGFELSKEYVYGNGRLLIVISSCGPRPDLLLSEPPESEGQVWFDRTDHLEPVGDFTIFIGGESGQWKTLSRASTLPPHFGIPKEELFPNETNWISIEAEGWCGQTGYSNSVSYAYYPESPDPPPSCLTGMGASAGGFEAGGSTLLTLRGSGGCAPGTTYNAYYERTGSGAVVKLNPVGLSSPRFELRSQAVGTGLGRYWFAPVEPLTRKEMGGGPQVRVDGRNFPSSSGGGGQEARGGGGGSSGFPSSNAQYVHGDHLGSVRLVTDEKGVAIGGWKYYPFGLEAEGWGGQAGRTKFAGHERDEGVGFDYMLARYYGANLGRFLSTDPARGGVRVVDPQSWNGYTYVGNNPLKFIDPDGQVKFATTDTETKYNEAKAYLTTSEEGQKLISSLESLSGSSEPTLVLNSNHDDRFDPSTNTIHWDPNSGLDVRGEGGKADSSGGTVQTPALGLAHEADHAVQHNTAPETQAKDAAKADAKYGNKEEKRVIEGSEKKLAKQLDEPTRKSHGGKPVRTKGPTDKQPATP